MNVAYECWLMVYCTRQWDAWYLFYVFYLFCWRIWDNNTLRQAEMTDLSFSFICLFHRKWHCLSKPDAIWKTNDHKCAVKLHFGLKNTLVRTPSGTRQQFLQIILRSPSEPDGTFPIPRQQDSDMHCCQRPGDCELHWMAQRCTNRFTLTWHITLNVSMLFSQNLSLH